MAGLKRITAWLKQHPSLYDLIRHRIYARIRSSNRRRIFSNIYQSNSWDGEESRSGIGSSLAATEALRAALPRVVAEFKVKSFLDIPCGDFHWMRSVSLGVDRYIGADIVDAVVANNNRLYSDRGTFMRLDLMADRLPQVDAIFCRDCFIHFSIREIWKALHNIRRAAPNYFMTTTFPDCMTNIDTVTPYWRPINLQAAPFNLGKPILLLKDFSTNQESRQGNYLGVWRVSDMVF
jgi:hypothetical protein